MSATDKEVREVLTKLTNLFEHEVGDGDYRQGKMLEMNCFTLSHVDPVFLNQDHVMPVFDESWNPEPMGVLPSWANVSRCYDLLEEIQTLEAERDKPDLKEDKTWENETMVESKAFKFLNWIDKNGGNTAKIKLRLNNDKNAYQVWAKEDVPQGDDVFVVNCSVFIVSDILKEDLKILPMKKQQPGKTLSIKIEARTELIRHALLLIHEKYVKGNSSFYKPWLDVLPRLSSYVGLCTYSRADMELLKESRHALRAAWHEVSSVIEDYIFLRKHLPQLKGEKVTTKFYKQIEKVITFRRFLWARVRVMSRQGRVDYGISKVLIPMAEMVLLQGTYLENTEFGIGVEDPICIFLAKEPLQSDSQLFMLATSTGSALYFNEYGWVPENYPVESEMYTLELGISRSDPLFKRKTEIAGKKLKLPGRVISFRIKPQLFICDVESPSNRLAFDGLLSFVRIIQADEELLDRVDKEGVDFLNEPTQESWKYLLTRFKLLKVGTEKTLENVLRKLNIGKDEVSTVSQKQQAFIQYLNSEVATLNCLAENTLKMYEEFS